MMKSKFSKTAFITIYLMCLCFLVKAQIKPKKDWVSPNAWEKRERQNSREENKENSIEESSGKSECICPECPNIEEIKVVKENTEDEVALLFYRKLLRKLFDRTAYTKDINKHKRALLFTISENEFKLIEESKDPRDWDEFVSRVFDNSKSTNIFEDGNYKENVSLLNIFNGFDFKQPLQYFEFNVYTTLICLAIPIWFLNTRRNYNLIALLLLGGFTIGYIRKYQQCNRELSIDRLANFVEHSTLKNPCEGFDITDNDMKLKEQPWYMKLTWSKPSRAEECAAYLKLKSKKMDDSDYCSPDDVFFQYVWDAYAKQLKMLVKNSYGIFEEIMKEYSFPYNMIVGGFYILLITSFLTIFVKYIIGTLFSRITLRDESNNNRPENNNRDQNQHHDRYHEMLMQQNASINILAQLAAGFSREPTNRGSSVQIIEAIDNSQNGAIEAAPAKESEVIKACSSQDSITPNSSLRIEDVSEKNENNSQNSKEEISSPPSIKLEEPNVISDKNNSGKIHS